MLGCCGYLATPLPITALPPQKSALLACNLTLVPYSAAASSRHPESFGILQRGGLCTHRGMDDHCYEGSEQCHCTNGAESLVDSHFHPFFAPRTKQMNQYLKSAVPMQLNGGMVHDVVSCRCLYHATHSCNTRCLFV